MGNIMMKQLYWLALQEGHINVRTVTLPFQQGSHFSILWSAGDCKIWPKFDKLVHIMTQNMESRKSMVWIHMDPYGSKRPISKFGSVAESP